MLLLACAAVLGSLGVASPAFAQTTSNQAFPKQQGGIFGSPKKVDQAQPLYLQGDKLIYDTSGQKVTARGNVEIFFNDYILTAEEVTYDQSANTLTAAGNVVLKEPNGNIVRADRYTLTDDFRDGFVQSLSVVAKDDTRIAAERATRRDGNVTEFSNGKFTPCKTQGAMPPLWCISAAKITHDQAAATISYQDAQFEFFGVPVVYVPYFQHADPSVKRRSGFLPPQYGHSDNLGYFAELPYYFALAPNYDFTFNPRYYSEQGVMWQGQWRHRLANGQYTINFSAIDQDIDDLPTTSRDRDSLDGWRGTVETRGKFSLASWWQLGWDITLDSDDTFRRFYQFDSAILTDRINNIFLTGQSERNYFGVNFYHFGGLLLQDTPQAESRVHPIIDYNYVFADPVLGGELKWDTNVLSFSRDDADNVRGQTNINRVVTELKWRRQLTDAIGISYTPFAEARGDIYQLNDGIDPMTGELADNETVTRGRVAGGAIVSYPWVSNGPTATQIIEPIGQIIARQESLQQRDLPVEDAKSLVFDDTNLFEVDKFSGYDRIETGTRANVGVQYTFQANSGGYARVLAGQSFQLSGDNAYSVPGVDADGKPIFSPISGLQRDESDYVLGAYIAPAEAFRLIYQGRFDEDDLDVRRQDVNAVVQLGPLSAQATYTYAQFDPTLGIKDAEQDITGSVGLRLTSNWSVIGSMRYDIDDEFTIQDAIQLRYADDCFILTATYTETFITDIDRDLKPDQTVMLRFAFKHLGEYQYKTDVLDHTVGEQAPGVISPLP